METTKTDIESITNAQQELPKIFRVKAIYGATFLGGPLAAGYIMAHNYKVFGDSTKARLSMVIAILSTILLFVFVFNLPSSTKIPNQIIPLFYTGIAYGIINHCQGKTIDAYLEQGGEHFSGWRTAGVGAISIAITTIGLFGYIYLKDPNFSASSKSFGTNEINYKSSNVTEAEVDRIAESLQRVGYFTPGRSLGVLLTKEKSRYIITFPLIKDAWEEPGTVNDFKNVRDEIQKDFPDKYIEIKLCSEDGYDDVKKVIL